MIVLCDIALAVDVVVYVYVDVVVVGVAAHGVVYADVALVI